MAQKSAEARRKVKAAAHERLTMDAPKTPEDLIGGMARVFAEVVNGKLDQTLRRSLATMANSILKGFEVVDIKKQLTEIERVLKERV